MLAPRKASSEALIIALALVLAIVFASLVLFVHRAHGGDRMLCHLAPMDSGGWHYRTKVGGRPEQCWYFGPPMKPRRELYWAEAPDIPPMSIMTPEPDNPIELRWPSQAPEK